MTTTQQRHQVQAERWLRHAENYRAESSGDEGRTALAYAQVHATLATIPPTVILTEVDERVLSVYRSVGKIPAIREYRSAMHELGADPGLREAKEHVERLCETTAT